MSYPTNEYEYQSLGGQAVLPETLEGFRAQYSIEPVCYYEPEDIDGIRIHPSAPAASLDAVRLRAERLDSLSRPWLPQKAKELLQRLSRGRVHESELIELMDIVADRVIEHFDLAEGDFVAISLSGKIAEIADSKLDLLRRIQGVNYPEPIFLWKVGSPSFSGRI